MNILKKSSSGASKHHVIINEIETNYNDKKLELDEELE